MRFSNATVGLFISMADKSKPETKAEPRNAVKVMLHHKGENPDDATAQTLTRPEVQAAATLQKWDGDSQEVNALIREMSAQTAAVNRGDLTRAEGMLLAQAHTLDAIFNYLSRRAHSNMGEYLTAAETYLRLALKAQSQCRATLETLALVKNPPNVAFVRQANIAHGPQQINNGMNAEGGASRTRETENLQNKLLEAQHGERLDATTAGAAIGADPQLATVEQINRAEVGKG